MHKDLNTIIAELHAQAEFRPTIVAIIRNDAGKFLLVESVYKPNDWGYIQGGIDQGEDIIDALRREVAEEITLAGEIVVESYLDLWQRNVSRFLDRGFSKGICYFFFFCTYTGSDGVLTDKQLKENNSFLWVDYADLSCFMQDGSKRDMLLRFAQLVVEA